MDAAILQFFKGIHVPRESYQAYLYAKREEIADEHTTVEHQLRALNVQKNNVASEKDAFYKRTGFGVSLEGEMKELWEKELAILNRKIERLEQEEKQISRGHDDFIQDEREFCKLIKSLPEIWQKQTTYVQKRQIAESMGLNIVVSATKELKTRIKDELQPLFVRDGGQEQLDTTPKVVFLKGGISRFYGKIVKKPGKYIYRLPQL